MNLFKQLESDMSEVKSDPRGSQRQCAVSPMNGLAWKNDKTRTDIIPIDGAIYSIPEHKSASTSLDFPPSLTRINLQSNTAASIFRQMEEEDEELGIKDSDSDSDSLDDFADTLGGDDEEEEAETKVESQPVSRTLYHQSAPHLRDYDSVSAGSRGSQSSGLATVGIVTHPSSESPKLQRPSSRTTIKRNLSNDSGVQFCTDTESNGTTTTASRTGPAGEENKKDPKAFANEVFAMLNF